MGACCRFIPDRSIDESNHTASSWGVTVNLGSIQGGQPKNVLKRVRVPANYHGPVLAATLKYRPQSSASGDELLSLAANLSLDGPRISSADSLVAEEIAAQRFRNAFVVLVNDVMNLMKSSTTVDAASALLAPLMASMREWVRDHSPESALSAGHRQVRQRVSDLLEDLQGQTTQVRCNI